MQLGTLVFSHTTSKMQLMTQDQGVFGCLVNAAFFFSFFWQQENHKLNNDVQSKVSLRGVQAPLVLRDGLH